MATSCHVRPCYNPASFQSPQVHHRSRTDSGSKKSSFPPPSPVFSAPSSVATMVYFAKLDDSPMFRDQVNLLEQSADQLKDRCQRFYKGCKKFIIALGEACGSDNAFADSLESFSGARDDLISTAIGGPVMSKYIATFRELGSYKELLRSQVEHMLSDRLLQFMNADLHDVKDSRRRFDKATLAYDQAREKFMSLKKSTRPDIVEELEEDLHNSMSAFERCRFNLTSALANIESKKKFEFLESLSAMMDAHLRYFKQGYELLQQLEPFIHEVLTYAQQSKVAALTEQDGLARRIQEFRTQRELENMQIDKEPTTTGDGIHVVGSSSYKTIEALMQATAHGKVQTIKQGYLLKRSSNLRGDWKRRFFVLDSHGTLYYYRTESSKPSGHLSHQLSGASDSSMFGRFRSSRPRASSMDENLGCRTVDLRTSTIKMDAEQMDLRFCFRIISPLKTYTLQAENGLDRMNWVDKITGVIASLLNAPLSMEHDPRKLDTKSYSFVHACGSDSAMLDSHLHGAGLEDGTTLQNHNEVPKILRKVPGNDMCAECGAPEPDWASLNLGILLCIECSGVHRNLGVHISKVRSLTLDVKVWEPVVIDLFHHLGNRFCNSVWEELPINEERKRDSNMNLSLGKPVPKDPLSRKDKYIQSKYAGKILMKKEDNFEMGFLALCIWNAVEKNDIQTLYRLMVASEASANTLYEQAYSNDLCHPVDISDLDGHNSEKKKYDPALCPRQANLGGAEKCWQGCSLMHLVCNGGELATAELLLQFGADINARDFHGRTPLHHCVSMKNNQFAKYLMRRGAHPSIKDAGGQSALERTMELGAITDEELLILLTNE